MKVIEDRVMFVVAVAIGGFFALLMAWTVVLLAVQVVQWMVAGD